MRKTMSKIWVPALLVMAAALQSFGIDASRAVGLKRLTDSLILNQLPDTLSAQDSILPVDPAHDSTVNLILSAKDTIKVPDSLLYTDPFKYRYYIALKDSTVRSHLRDSLLNAGDSLELHKLDSLYIKDSTEVAQAAFAKWYSSLTRKERKKYDAEQALPGLIEAQRLKMERKDSIKAAKTALDNAMVVSGKTVLANSTPGKDIYQNKNSLYVIPFLYPLAEQQNYLQISQ